MRALALTKNGNPFEIINIDEPQITKANQVKIKIHGTGICGGDLSDYLNPPSLNSSQLILGHEYSGEIVELGAKVTNFKIGDKVIAESSAGCEECFYCRNGYTNLCPDRKGISGSFTDYIVVPERYVYRLPAETSLDLAILSEPLACVLNGIEKTQLRAGDLTVVVGPGPLGILTAFLADLKGAAVILVGRSSSQKRLEIAQNKLNLEVINSDLVDPGEYIKKINSYGADVVFGCAGSEKIIDFALQILKKGGSYTELGLFHGSKITIDFEKIVKKELKVTGAVSHRPDSWNRLLKLYKRNDLNELSKIISSKYELKNWKTAFENLKERKDLKAVLY